MMTRFSQADDLKPRTGSVQPAILLFLMALSCLLLFPAGASAYTVEKHDEEVTGQYEVAPSKFELDMNPGDSSTQEVSIINRTGGVLTLELYVEDFEGSSNPSQPMVFLGDEDGARSAKNWMTPELSSIVLNQGETLVMQVRIVAPRSAEPGGHYAALVAAPTAGGGAAAGEEEITDQKSLFLINISGNIDASGSLNVPELTGFSERGPIGIGLVFNNLGNTHLQPSGRVVISNILGQTVAEIPVKEWVVLPEASRRTLVEWDTGYRFGRYTAKAEIEYGDGKVVVASRSFWVMPWKILLAGAAALVLIITLIMMQVRRRPGPERPKAEEPPEEAPPATEIGTAASVEPRTDKVPLSELFPSMDDHRVVDLSDRETQKIIRELIENQMDMARAYIGQGDIEAARRELMESRAAAHRIGLLFEVGNIDDMLRDL
jgi:hypothetical protein